MKNQNNNDPALTGLACLLLIYILIYALIVAMSGCATAEKKSQKEMRGYGPGKWKRGPHPQNFRFNGY